MEKAQMVLTEHKEMLDELSGLYKFYLTEEENAKLDRERKQLDFFKRPSIFSPNFLQELIGKKDDGVYRGIERNMEFYSYGIPDEITRCYANRAPKRKRDRKTFLTMRFTNPL